MCKKKKEMKKLKQLFCKHKYEKIGSIKRPGAFNLSMKVNDKEVWSKINKINYVVDNYYKCVKCGKEKAIYRENK